MTQSALKLPSCEPLRLQICNCGCHQASSQSPKNNEGGLAVPSAQEPFLLTQTPPLGDKLMWKFCLCSIFCSCPPICLATCATDSFFFQKLRRERFKATYLHSRCANLFRSAERASGKTVTLAVIRQSGRESWTFKPGANLTSPSSTVIVHQDRELQADTFVKASRAFWREEMLKNKLRLAQLIDGAGRGAQIKG